MKSIFDKHSHVFVLGFVFLTVSVLSSPFWLWQLKPEETLDILIVDKTVPDKDYREHKGLTWVLNNEKYIKSDGSPYSAASDYIGFKHLNHDTFSGETIPENLDQYNVIYLADLYGVYEEEFHGENETGKRSKQLYGGLQLEDVKVLERELLEGNKTLISEFNTFGSPTEESARKEMTNLLNVRWSGWTGRYFTKLEGNEVPRWIITQYESQNKEWDFSGPGLVFVNEEDYVAVLDQTKLSGKGLDFKLTENGKEHFSSDLDTSYTYWFDIVEPLDVNEVMASYHLPIKDEARTEMAGYGIPDQFPAVIYHQNQKYSAYYFAGDYADEAEVPDIYQTKGLTSWKKAVEGKRSFYWSAYVPMIKEILSNGLHESSGKAADLEVATAGEIRYYSSNSADSIQIQKNGKWEDILIKGANIGMGKPGAFPGEAAITKEEYFRWFKLIGSMNANAIRIYTLHPPEFYQAFYEYNQLAKEPLYLFHGAWVNEEIIVETQNAFSKEVVKDFKRELKQMVDIVHGNADIAPSPGHASGKYEYDISPYVLGFIIGIEWDPGAVLSTNTINNGMEPFSGTYFRTENAEPFENWLAAMMEYTAGYETQHYRWQHSISFTNWVTTDLLEHPSEPLETEDMVSVNPNHIQKNKEFKAGMFASYHVYPYYPDFLNYDESYQNYKDQQGRTNHYAGYLRDLIQAHEMPVLIAEFGVPSSRGQTHKNDSGMNQGSLNEQQQGEMNSSMFNSMVDEGAAGGLVFAWQDEWFKRTWNTMDYDNPNRRPFWSNRQTNEQNFGLLSFEPGKKSLPMLVDGRKGDWEKKRIKPLSDSNTGAIKSVFATSDESSVYFRLDLEDAFDWEEQFAYLFLDTIPGQGQHRVLLDDGQEMDSEQGIDFIIELKGPEKSRILVDSYYDLFYYQYGKTLKMIPEVKKADEKNNGMFHPIRLALNKEMVLPESGRKVPFQSYETGKLELGTGNPEDESFDSLTDISISDDNRTVEIRIPWQLLNVKDPSTKEIIANLYETGLSGSEYIDGIGVAAALVSTGENITVLPESQSKIDSMFFYEWKGWEEPRYYERLKKSYNIMKETFEKAGDEENN
ncbi:hypothetical protein [Mesobacillus jeotgali]|uniref:Glycosyl transferase family 2 n=1 Tax=Mesobacillus jeotgali TaxID=129985 RepID=A0ABY9VMU1_9BACI|nr:hypothetical protein [Mesobacillus jeotgali]WNF23935.1 hypothetical protein RH061_05445 [Mesobacillus jeotgali]